MRQHGLGDISRDDFTVGTHTASGKQCLVTRSTGHVQPGPTSAMSSIVFVTGSKPLERTFSHFAQPDAAVSHVSRTAKIFSLSVMIRSSHQIR
jgi:hypothetical protein